MTRHAAAGALLEVQLLHLTAQGQPLIDDPAAGATEMLDFLAAVPKALAEVMGGTLDELGSHGMVAMVPADREELLRRLWAAPAWRGRLSLLLRLGWLIIYSRPPARRVVGFRDPREFHPDDPTVHVAQPPLPSLEDDYDVCIIGSGAGAAVVAARLAEAGRRVLMVERGDWISPRDLPTRDDEALRRLYLHGGVNPALSDEIRALVEVCRNQIGTINVLQAGVVGGGPYVNNAILLPMARTTWQTWREQFDFPIDWPQLEERMDLVARELGSQPSGAAAGPRSRLFRQGAQQLGRASADLPLAIHDCLGCGGCNMCCRFGRKTGGLHGDRPAGAPVSYLHRALAVDPGPAAIRPRLEALKFKRAGFFSNRVGALVARDLAAAGAEVTIKARCFALAAGPIASSQILGRTLTNPDFRPGTGISANVVMPVFALSPTPLGGAPDPGIEMCYFVDAGGGLLLESWFHYPASLAIAIPGWLDEHAATMRCYGRLASAGVVVPSRPSGRLGLVTDIVLGLDHDELERLKRGVVELAALFLAAGVETVIPSTSDPLPIRRGQEDADIARFRGQVTTPAQLNLGTAHPQGGNRIGTRSGSSVVDASFRVHGVANLFVTDASVFPAGCGVNPQLTVMALATLAADEINHFLG
jgi:choline dehydrogenase-like flavoprotein